MAKITILGDAVVITSAMKLEDLLTVKKYRPDALTLKGGEDGKEPVFRIDVTKGSGSIGQYGASFAAETHDGAKLATITVVAPDIEGDIKEYIADKLGSAITSLNKLEATLPDIVQAVADEKAQVMNAISVAQ